MTSEWKSQIYKSLPFVTHFFGISCRPGFSDEGWVEWGVGWKENRWVTTLADHPTPQKLVYKL